MWKSSEDGMSKLSKPRKGSSSLRLSDTKRRPSVLRKESKETESQTDSDVGNGIVLGGHSDLKRRFSLKDAVRRIFSSKQANESPRIQQQNTISPIQMNSSTQYQIDGIPLAQSPIVRESKITRVNGEQPNGQNENSGENPYPELAAPRQVLSIVSDSSASAISNDSVNIASTVLLSPRPIHHTDNQHQYPKQEGKRLLFKTDISLLFDGAPIFSVDESQGKYGQPSVRFSEDRPRVPPLNPSSCDDASQIDHHAYRGYSNRNIQGRSPTDSEHHWLNGPTETPSMASFCGSEPGSTGWEYFLEAQAVDYEVQEGNTSGEIDEYGVEFQPPDSIGVRSIDSTTLIDRLRDIGKFHGRAYSLDNGVDIEARFLYGYLFTKLLYPARKPLETGDPREYSLEKQCQELLKILEARHVWLDFSRPEERIRLGYILYGNAGEKLLLVLQILLSCELWLRLKLLHRYEPERLKLGSLYFTPKVNWDLTIAEKWLANVQIVERPFTPNFEMLTIPQTQNVSSWHRFFLTDSDSIEDAEDPQEVDTYDAFFVPQHLERQLDGLLHFARKIDWPGIEILEGVIRDRLRNPTGRHTPSSMLGYRTPGNSPGKLTPRSIGGAAGSSHFGYFASKHTSSAIVRNMGEGGWLSRAYMAGLVLPGEGLSHLLMGCLLENDTLALNEVGENGSMYGGIIRRTLESPGSTASWWSMNNIVGKVLATRTSRSYAGWVGKCVGVYTTEDTTTSDLTVLTAVAGAAKLVRSTAKNAMGSQQREGMKLAEPIGWVDVITDRRQTKKWVPRLLTPGRVEPESSFLGPVHLSDCSIGPEELRYPEILPPQDIKIQIMGLRFWGASALQYTTDLPESGHGYYTPKEWDPSDDMTPAYRVDVMFRVPIAGPSAASCFDSVDGDIIGILLKYESSFVTSYPCHLPNPAESLELKKLLFESNLTRARTVAHPIHHSYKFKVVEATKLPEHSPARRSGREDKDYFVTVINAKLKGVGQDLYVYAKAWCSRWGADAIISRENRTCLSCAIREAYALAVDVVIDVN
ncbi:hypothetical protein TWF106_002410 [Orbilia oligospora]|uniref:Uncharacterized protein n=1 Tax=Orbilia oligospora TaxID=2813651 RepID=A0A7C8UG00_ORBOL|nr:hypothetical protein TWF106_002410 [Orbilia oligospora]